ncbi:MAG: DUF4743 domain-containing protein [Acetobacterales bacterium]
MAFLDHIRACNNGGDRAGWLPFRVAGATVGTVRPEFASLLRAPDGPFRVDGQAVAVDEALSTPDMRSAAAGRFLHALAGQGHIRAWKGEPYPVLTGWGAALLMTLERAAAPYLGIRAFGLHVVGYVRKPDGPHLWIARRALDRATSPGKLDTIVAGGQPAGLSLSGNLVKESAEEAGMPAELARTARPAGTVSYVQRVPEGLRRDTLFVYDIEVPAGFLPVCADGENEGYELWPVAEVAARVRDTDDFKFNVSLVLIDFLIRHGVVTPDNEPDYLRLVAGLRVLDRPV